MSVRVNDLKDQTGKIGPHPFLYCMDCGASYSANKGDYFNHPHNYVFMCCEVPMILVRSRVIYEQVEVETGT